MIETYVALLRGINVGGKNRLPMKDLLQFFLECECREPRNYIQSGNVVFGAEPALAARAPEIISARIAERFGFNTPVILRTASQMDAVVRNNPFIATAKDEAALHVVFLADLPSAARVASLDPDRSPNGAYIVHGQEIYLSLPKGMAETKLTNAYFDARLATISTMRNWRTVNTLREMMA